MATSSHLANLLQDTEAAMNTLKGIIGKREPRRSDLLVLQSLEKRRFEVIAQIRMEEEEADLSWKHVSTESSAIPK